MLERVQSTRSPHRYQQRPTLSLQRSQKFIEKVYEAFWQKGAGRHNTVKKLNGAFIKFEPYDCATRPVFKELIYWPEISTQVDKQEISEERRKETPQEFPKVEKMTRRGGGGGAGGGGSTTRGYCEMCARAYSDAQAHRASSVHKAFLRDPNNFMALDNLISAGADVSAFLAKSKEPVNGERRSLRKLCNGDAESTAQKEKEEKDKDYYKVVGVTTKLRSGASFQQQPAKDQNGLVVKFRKVRRSELSVLSDEAEQFMFPRKDDSSTEEDEEEQVNGKTVQQEKYNNDNSILSDRRRTARPLALKEESSSEDSQDERPPPHSYQTRKHSHSITMKEESSEEEEVNDNNSRKRRHSQRRQFPKLKLEPPTPEVVEKIEPEAEICTPIAEATTLLETSNERCLKWESGRLRASDAVEDLVYSFELPPSTESWYTAYSRQDTGVKVCKNNPQELFEFYLGCPRLPYQMPPLPPLRPGCCKLSSIQRIQEPSKQYGTRLGKKQKGRKRAQQDTGKASTSSNGSGRSNSINGLPRKSPREHASTLAILGTMRNEDSRSLPSVPEESDIPEPAPTVQRLLETVFDDAYEYDIPIEAMDPDASIRRLEPDIANLVTNFDDREFLEMSSFKQRRKGRFKKKKNKTGWPKQKRIKLLEGDSESQTSHETSQEASEVDSLQYKEDLLQNKEDSLQNKEVAVKKDKKLYNNLQPVVRVTKIDVDRKLRSSDGLKVKRRR